MQYQIEADCTCDAWHDIVDNGELTFMTSGYRAGLEYWECVDWLRKLTFSATLSLFPAGAPAQAGFTTMLSAAWAIAQAHLMPYRFVEDNALKLCAELCIIATLTASLCLKLVNGGARSEFSVAEYGEFLTTAYIGLGVCPVLACFLCKLCRVAPRFSCTRGLIRVNTRCVRCWGCAIRALEKECDDPRTILESFERMDVTSEKKITNATPEEIFMHYRIGLAGSKNRGILCEHFERLAQRSHMLYQNDLLSAPMRVVVSTPEQSNPDEFGNKTDVMGFIRTLCSDFPDLWSMGFDWANSWDSKTATNISNTQIVCQNLITGLIVCVADRPRILISLPPPSLPFFTTGPATWRCH